MANTKFSLLFALIFTLLFMGVLKVQKAHGRSENFPLNIRLDLPGHSMANVPVTNQKGVPLCYAYSAAQMVDAYRNSFDGQAAKGHQTSGMAAAVWASWDTGLNYLETLNYGGFLCEAVDSIIKYGSCKAQKTHNIFLSIKGLREEGMEEEYKKMFGSTFHGKVYRSELVHDRYLKAAFILRKFISGFNKPGSLRAGSRSRSYFSYMHVHYSHLIFELKQLGLRDEFLPSPKELRSFLERMPWGHRWSQGGINRMKILKSLVDEACEDSKEDLSHLNLKCVEKLRQSPERASGQDLLALASKALSKGKRSQPVGIKYCANFFEEGPHYSGIQRRKDSSKVGWKGNCQIHYSLIIGKRQVEHKVQYLVRDSYGKDCGKSSLHSSWNCEEGNIWVDSEIILNNLLGVGFLTSSF